MAARGDATRARRLAGELQARDVAATLARYAEELEQAAAEKEQHAAMLARSLPHAHLSDEIRHWLAQLDHQGPPRPLK